MISAVEERCNFDLLVEPAHPIRMNLSIVGSDVHVFEIVGQRDGPGARLISLVERDLGSSVNLLKDLRNVADVLVATATPACYTEKRSVSFSRGRERLIAIETSVDNLLPPLGSQLQQKMLQEP